MVKVRIENLVKRFGKTVAVDNVSLTIEDGSFACLLGPSGCGKTTTLRIVAGLEFQDGGEVYFDDRRVDQLPTGERNVSMVFQFYAIYPNMTVFDEIGFPLKMMKRPEQEIRERVKKVAETVGLESILEERASRLTVDKKQRIELARAIIREPEVFLFDEPLTNLDTNLRADMRAEIARIQKELSITTIYVTHDQLEAMSIADKIAVMNQGKILQYESAGNVYDDPANLFVAGFIGTPPMNFIDCEVRSVGSRRFLDAAEFVIPADDLVAGPDDGEGKKMILGIRPEYISIVRSPGNGTIKGKVDVVEPLGHRLVVNVKIGAIALKINSPYQNLSTGDEVGLRFLTEHARLFDPASGSASAR